MLKDFTPFGCISKCYETNFGRLHRNARLLAILIMVVKIKLG
jgi:hypothetical protein